MSALGLLLWVVGVQLNELFALIGAALTLIAVVVGVVRKELIVPWPLVTGIGVFIVWGLLASTLAGRPPTPDGVARLFDWLLLPVAAVAWNAASEVQRRRVVVAGGVTLLISCAVAALQYFGRWPPSEAFAPFAWTRIPFDRVYESVPGRDDRFMAGGLAFHRLRFAHVGGLLAVTGCVAALSSARPRWGLLAVGTVVLLSVAIFPHARAAFGAAVLSMLVGVSCARRNLQATLVTAIVLTAAFGSVLIFSPSMRERLQSSLSEEGSGERQYLVQAGLNAIAAHPIAGVGAGAFRPGKWSAPDAPQEVLEHPGRAHNQLVTIAAELGFPGLFAWLALLGFLAAVAWTARERGAPLAAALVYVLALGLLHDVLFHAEVSLAIVVVFGCAAAHAKLPA